MGSEICYINPADAKTCINVPLTLLGFAGCNFIIGDQDADLIIKAPLFRMHSIIANFYD